MIKAWLSVAALIGVVFLIGAALSFSPCDHAFWAGVRTVWGVVHCR